jgi:hypothetical protein
VPEIWHSGKPEALGKFPFSRSARILFLFFTFYFLSFFNNFFISYVHNNIHILVWIFYHRWYLSTPGGSYPRHADSTTCISSP